MVTESFQRARQPEQIAARRAAILATAREMLAERSVADISLRELSDRIGLAKSNVMRYFVSREAIFLEILDEDWKRWLDVVAARLEESLSTASTASTARFAREAGLASLIANTLAERPLLCDLIGVMSSVLERNITVEFAREFRGRAEANTARLHLLIRDRLPELDQTRGLHAAGATFFMVAGLWPFANPADAVADGADPATLRQIFVDDLTEGLTNLFVGLTVRASA